MSILLQLCDQLIALPDNIVILLVLVIRTVGLYYALPSNTIDGAGYTISSDELCKVTTYELVKGFAQSEMNLPVEEVNRNAKVVGHTLQAHNAIALQ